MTSIVDPAKKVAVAWRFSIGSAFLFLYFLPSTLGSGIGPYSFVLVGSLFLLLFGLFLLMKPGFNLRIRGGWELSYFVGLPVLTGIWMVILRTSNALGEFIHVSLGAVTILLTMWLFRDASGIHRLVRVAKVGGAILALWGLAEIFLGSARFPTAGWGNPNYLTTYFALITPILWVEVLGLVGKPRWSSALLLGLLVVTTILAGSRANLLAIVIQGGIVGWQRLAMYNRAKRYVLQVFFILIIVGIGGTIVRKIISERGEASLTSQVSRGKGSAFVRAIMIYDGLRLFRESDGMGVGAGNVTYAMSSQPDADQHPPNQIYPLHNFPIQLASQYGIPGLLLFGTSYLSLLFGLHRRGRNSRAPPNSAVQSVEIVRRSGWAFLFSFVLISISVSYLFDRRPFYLAFGLYLTVNQYLHRQEDRAQQVA